MSYVIESSAQLGASDAVAAAHPVRKAVNPLALILIAATWIATIGNIPLWLALSRIAELQSARGFCFAMSFAIVIAAATFALLSFVAWKRSLKAAIAFLFVLAAISGYFMLSYGIVIDRSMIANAMQTDLHEAADLMSWRFVAWVLVTAVLPAALIWRIPQRDAGWVKQGVRNVLTLLGALVVIVGVILVQFKDVSSVMRNHTQVRYLINPMSTLVAFVSETVRPLRHRATVVVPIALDVKMSAAAVPAAKPPLLVLVVGETARSGNFSLNGYERQTNPELAVENVVSLTNAWSCGTSTAASVPCMFSHLGKTGFGKREAEYEGLLDVIQRAGMGVLWIDNQAGCKSVCDRVPTVSTTELKEPALCDSGECFDEIMLNGLDERIATLPAERRAKGVVVVMHQMGSHGPAYYKRAPTAYKKFKPECITNALQDCPREEVVNAFDNTILYTDHFLASTIRWLKARQETNATAMMYVSDHGESLGEKNLYLHGLPYGLAPDVQKRVPWILWLSSGFEGRMKVTAPCLRGKRDMLLSHDNYFHSVLGMLRLSTSVYQPELDLFKVCDGRDA